MIDALATSTPLRSAVLLVLFLFVALTVRSVAALASRRQIIRSRIADTAGHAATADYSVIHNLREQANNQSWFRLTEAIERAGIPLTDQGNDNLKAKLAAAGFSGSSVAAGFTMARIGLLLALPTSFLLIALSRSERPSILTLYLVSSLLALLGMYLPNIWLNRRVENRKQEVINGFPDCLDLMLICVEAGLGMEAAFDRVGREIVQSHPRLATLLSSVTLELRAGSTRELALRGLAQRAQVEEIRSFTTLLIQSDKLGTSIGATLRIYSSEMRERRRMRAEEKAHRLPVLLSIPLVVCMMPTMMGVLMLPASISVAKAVLPLMKVQR